MSPHGDSLAGLVPHSEDTFVISDATPVHYLVPIGEIDILRILYGKVVIPTAVARELSTHQTPALVRSWIGSMPSWAGVVSAPQTASLSPRFRSLGRGEIEALALAQLFADSIVLTDDLQARFAAKSIGVQTVPTLRILSTASRFHLLDLKDAVRRLQLTNFRASREVIESVLKRSLIESSG